ncbi:endonuclease III [uncultured Veillonella sp.]|uniref:endonuclease III n=1 Tax=uncultured Veillonella sp. TaxID=159268 RepID=UPI0025EE957A|nr:endonuclease III [uncultured Veillonella sp.]
MRVTKAIKSEQIHILETVYKDAKVALDYNNPFELLVAVVLSAQCTDERVNIITKRLFPAYDHPAKMLALGVPKLEVLIRDCGLYRAKAANLIKTCQILLEKYHGEVPEQFDELVTLPGVGRKTANVLISVLFNTPAIAVDTHVFRVSNRLGLARGKTPDEVEEKLKKAIPMDKWSAAHHWIIWHGRKICKARKPLCGECPLAQVCPSAGKE